LAQGSFGSEDEWYLIERFIDYLNPKLRRG
jgi:hypothetical protein